MNRFGFPLDKLYCISFLLEKEPNANKFAKKNKTISRSY